MADPAFSLIIPAAGSGERMQAKIAKPYLQLGNCTVLEHTLTCFMGLSGLKQVIVSTSKPFRIQTEEILHRLFPKIISKTVNGGIERQHSVYNALKEVDDEIKLVAVHDAVRPFVSEKSIQACLRKASESGAAVLGVPVRDTIKKVDNQGNILETPDRSELWQAQTPQIFWRTLLIDAYEQAMSDVKTGTDDASLVEAFGRVVSLVEGNRENFKLTYPIDFRNAEKYLDDFKTNHSS